MKYDWREEEDRLPDVVYDDDCATGLLRAWYEEEEEGGGGLCMEPGERGT